MSYKFVLLFLSALLISGFLMFKSVLGDSITYDEPLHVASGLEWLSTFNSPTDPFNPPLAKLPVVFTQNIFLLRMASIVYTLLLVIIVYIWTDRKFGKKVGLISTIVLAFEPTVLGHGHLFTTDSLAALVFFWAFATYDLWPKWHWVSLVFLIWTKTTLLPMWVIVLCWQYFVDKEKLKQTYFSVKMIPVLMSIILVGEILLHDASYVFNPKFSSTHTFMLFGNLSSSGWIHYPIVVLLLKLSPLMFLGFLSMHKNVSRVVLPAMAVIIVAIIGRYNTGVRHLLPAYPFIAILAGVFISRVSSLLVVILLVFHVLAATLTVDYIAYFNPLVGSKIGGQIIVESNLDIGQSLNRAKTEIDFSKLDIVLSNNHGAKRITGDVTDKKILMSRTLWYTHNYYLDPIFNQKKQTLIADNTMILLE